MEYLFFDLEFASQINGTKICEFGYVITDEEFNVIERHNFIINPNIYKYQWDKRVVNTILTRTVRQYELSYTFDSYYDIIKEIFSEVDYVFGHTTDSDAKALNDDIQRYKLPPINYEFYDIKEFYKQYKNEKRDIALKDILKEFKVEGDDLEHDAESDAYNTMLALKAMCNALNTNLNSLIQQCPDARDKTTDFVIESLEKRNLIREEEFIKYFTGDETNIMPKNSINYIRFHQFVDNVMPNKKGRKIFDNKRITFSSNYKCDHYSQMLNLVQMIKNEGGAYTSNINKSQIYISYDKYDKDGNLIICDTDEMVKKKANIEILSFPMLLKRLNITEEYLDSLPRVSFDFFYDSNAHIKSNTDRATIERLKAKKNINKNEDEFIHATTLGDRFGDLFSSILKKA